MTTNNRIAERNERLVARYYYYGYIAGWHYKYSAIIKALAAEFNLSEQHTFNTLMMLDKETNAIRALKPSLSTLKKKWFFCNWSKNVQIPESLLK